jgi:glycyl-tRNA synthetase
MTAKMNYQDMILRLVEYWQDWGCVVWNPYNVQVGAGTMNPATALRVLGPEPWNVVYVEPSVRPDDGRFGDNPNRMQLFYQLQVILKPDPGNPQELYEKSLEAVGINPREHDLRYVEDNWQSPVLGAWGLGWEVWLDGQEITQFTYFQQSGSLELDPVSVELTYGLDRIALALQGVDSVWELDWGAGVPYADVLLQSEIEHCRYYFEVADVDALRKVYDTYENEARRCIDANLVIPAHDYNLKCSHIFNVLDTRGAIGVTERAHFFRRMRNVAREVSELFVEQRQRLEFPLLEHEPWQVATPATSANGGQPRPGDTPQRFVLEIGSEELPAGDLDSAIAQLQTTLPELLADLRLEYESVSVLGTPRRLTALVEGLAPRQTDLETEMKGPPAARAFDQEGNPTPAAQGFARSKGVPVSALRIVTEGDKEYVAATVREEGRPAGEVLATSLPDLIAGLKFEKSMRWNGTNISFSRPLRWLVALLGTAVVPFAYAGVVTGRVSRGLRPYQEPPIEIPHADDYLSLMAAHGIVVDPEKRREIIRANAAQLAVEKQGIIPADAGLLAEVTNLVERPTTLLGAFAPRHLELPEEVLIAVMRKHQRYFPVRSAKGELLPYFITVRNGDREHLDLVRAGNEHVIKARFADAEFFYKNDTKQTLVDFIPALGKLTFQTELGSMLDKTHRLAELVPAVGGMLNLSPEEMETATRAADLAKADLATEMVVEMTSLQGIMGGHYARRDGETAAVAEAIAEQYEPVSQTRPGLALALADRLDSLAGLFAAGLAPKGSNDPFALRRSAIQIVENLTANEISFDLRLGLAHAAALLPVPTDEYILAEVLEFIAGRLESYLREQGYAIAVIKAVLAEQAHDPYPAGVTVTALETAIQAPDWPHLLDAYARCVRIVRNQDQSYPLDPTKIDEPATQALYAAYQEVRGQQDGTLAPFLAGLRDLEPVISQFFDDVLVMVDDREVRENRLALLQHIAKLPSGIVDLSYLEGF